LLAVAIVTDTETPVCPCGMCRQMIREFAEDLRVGAEWSVGQGRGAGSPLPEDVAGLPEELVAQPEDRAVRVGGMVGHDFGNEKSAPHEPGFTAEPSEGFQPVGAVVRHDQGQIGTGYRGIPGKSSPEDGQHQCHVEGVEPPGFERSEQQSLTGTLVHASDPVRKTPVEGF